MSRKPPSVKATTLGMHCSVDNLPALSLFSDVRGTSLVVKQSHCCHDSSTLTQRKLKMRKGGEFANTTTATSSQLKIRG